MLSNEKRLLLLTSRITSNENINNEILEIVFSNLNWFEFVQYTLYHKTFNLDIYNILKLSDDINMPKYLHDIYKITYYGNVERNMMYSKESIKLHKILHEENITCLPVKGVYLIDSLYSDYGIRYLGDIDFLCSYCDEKKIEMIMRNNQYIQGNYRYQNFEITKAARADILKSKITMTNFHPYMKIANQDKEIMYKVDFRYSLDNKRTKEAVDEIINQYSERQSVNHAHMFIHLCAHFFSEATHVNAKVAAKDFNLIKLCDIREYALKYLNSDVLADVYDFIERYSYQHMVFFAAYMSYIIYEDNLFLSILNNLNNYKMLSLKSTNFSGDVNIDKDKLYDLIFSCHNVR